MSGISIPKMFLFPTNNNRRRIREKSRFTRSGCSCFCSIRVPTVFISNIKRSIMLNTPPPPREATLFLLCGADEPQIVFKPEQDRAPAFQDLSPEIFAQFLDFLGIDDVVELTRITGLCANFRCARAYVTHLRCASLLLAASPLVAVFPGTTHLSISGFADVHESVFADVHKTIRVCGGSTGENPRLEGVSRGAAVAQAHAAIVACAGAFPRLADLKLDHWHDEDDQFHAPHCGRACLAAVALQRQLGSFRCLVCIQGGTYLCESADAFEPETSAPIYRFDDLGGCLCGSIVEHFPFSALVCSLAIFHSVQLCVQLCDRPLSRSATTQSVTNTPGHARTGDGVPVDWGVKRRRMDMVSNMANVLQFRARRGGDVLQVLFSEVLQYFSEAGSAYIVEGETEEDLGGSLSEFLLHTEDMDKLHDPAEYAHLDFSSFVVGPSGSESRQEAVHRIRDALERRGRGEISVRQLAELLEKACRDAGAA